MPRNRYSRAECTSDVNGSTWRSIKGRAKLNFNTATSKSFWKDLLSGNPRSVGLTRSGAVRHREGFRKLDEKVTRDLYNSTSSSLWKRCAEKIHRATTELPPVQDIPQDVVVDGESYCGRCMQHAGLYRLNRSWKCPHAAVENLDDPLKATKHNFRVHDVRRIVPTPLESSARPNFAQEQEPPIARAPFELGMSTPNASSSSIQQESFHCPHFKRNCTTISCMCGHFDTAVPLQADTYVQLDMKFPPEAAESQQAPRDPIIEARVCRREYLARPDSLKAVREDLKRLKLLTSRP